MTSNRHGANSVIAGQSVGGQFAASSKTTANEGALASTGPQTFAITTPPRRLNLVMGETPSWPEGWSDPAVTFAEDDSGRFCTTWTFAHASGHDDATIWCTDYEEGPEFSADEDIFDDGLDDSARAPLLKAHAALRTNAYRAGYAACDEDPELTRKVLAASLGRPMYDDAQDAVPAPALAVARAERNIVGWGDGGAPEEDIRDVMTDLAHYAEKHDLDIRELFERAIEMQQDEKENPHG